ncbi:hypothetical protein BV25DRAFT_1824826 [Artomyces pyxidatus]|uniref:Uncharacterized protein n=1 Tax=Artomyces pyxidatus TaxID=48021 RepID=A0ACB8T4R8_9AGAM|nr:hypothetical protein BV25DRAFT_1824826 [Artomyces pyxidatus]
MGSIGPQIPSEIAASSSYSTTPPPPSIGPSVGPQLPQLASDTPAAQAPRYEEEEEEEEDDYAPALPPDLAAARSSAPRRQYGPARGPRREEEEEDSDEDDVGPTPLPVGVQQAERDPVREFMDKEEQRRKAIEEAAKPKALQRQEWMLVPPSSSDLLSTLDPTKLSKPRQFSRSTAPARSTDNSLWTETPAERQQRIADEVMGKKRRVENAEVDPDAEEDARKRRKRDEELKREVEEHTRKHRGAALLDAHAEQDAKRKKSESEEAPGIWDHSRDMGMGGRLMDEKDRRRIIQDARGLSERFGAGRSGGFL